MCINLAGLDNCAIAYNLTTRSRYNCNIGLFLARQRLKKSRPFVAAEGGSRTIRESIVHRRLKDQIPPKGGLDRSVREGNLVLNRQGDPETGDRRIIESWLARQVYEQNQPRGCTRTCAGICAMPRQCR